MSIHKVYKGSHIYLLMGFILVIMTEKYAVRTTLKRCSLMTYISPVMALIYLEYILSVYVTYHTIISFSTTRIHCSVLFNMRIVQHIPTVSSIFVLRTSFPLCPFFKLYF